MILRYIKRRRMIIIIGLCVGSVLYLLQQLLRLGTQLDAMGQEGDHQAQVWGLVVAILGLIVSLLTVLVPIWLHKQESKISNSKPVKQKSLFATPGFTWRNVVLGIIFALLAFFIPIMVTNLAFWYWETEDITRQIKLIDNSSMEHGDKAHAILPATQHQHLKIKFKLESQTSTGSCVAPARMTVVPTYNGNNGTAITSVSSGNWQNIELGSSQEKTELEVTLNLIDEPLCTVKLNIGSAFYYQ